MMFGIRSQNGFTLIELIVAIAMISIVISMAVPSFMQMRENATYRDAARMVANQLQEVRSLTIRDGIAHRIQCIPAAASGTCELQLVDFNTTTNAFEATTLSSYTFPRDVVMRTGPTCATTTTVEIEYFPNGNAELRSGPATNQTTPPLDPPATVCVIEPSGAIRFMVNLRSLTTGSAEITRP